MAEECVQKGIKWNGAEVKCSVLLFFKVQTNLVPSTAECPMPMNYCALRNLCCLLAFSHF